MSREQILEEALRRAIGLLSIAGSAATIDEMEELRAALSTPAEPRTVEPLTNAEIYDLDWPADVGGFDEVRHITHAALNAAARKWGLVLARGEQG